VKGHARLAGEFRRIRSSTATLLNDGMLLLLFISKIDLPAMKLFFGGIITKEAARSAVNKYAYCRLISEKKWQKVYSTLFAQADFAFAVMIKAQAGKARLREVRSLRRPFIEMLKVLVFLEDYEEVRQFLDTLPKGQNLSPHEREAVAYSCLLSGQKEKALLVWNSREKDATEAAYEDYIRGKQVAIVGPSFSDRDIGSEIDSFDVVIRTNVFRGAKLNALGSRTDICYYNGEQSILLAQEKAFPLDDLKFIVLKDDRSSSHALQNASLLRIYTDKLMYKGSFMGMQRIIYHVLHYQPSRIVLFNADFYTGQTAYHQDYVSAKNTRLPLRSFLIHDVIQNFIIAKRLYDLGYLEARYNARDILQSTKASYIRKLITLYY
jgi:hypothetical protein